MTSHVSSCYETSGSFTPKQAIEHCRGFIINVDLQYKTALTPKLELKDINHGFAID